jgi:hypothetical protein
MTEKHSPHLSQFVNAGAHRLSFWHSVVCPSDSAHSRQYEITPELDFLHGSTSHRGHPGPGLHFITLSPLISAGSSSPFRQYSPSSSLLSSGQEYPHPSSSIGGISTAREKECLPFSSCLAPHRLHSQSSKYSLPSIVFINHQKQLTMQINSDGFAAGYLRRYPHLTIISAAASAHSFPISGHPKL